jgi:hypothetical protein
MKVQLKMEQMKKSGWIRSSQNKKRTQNLPNAKVINDGTHWRYFVQIARHAMGQMGRQNNDQAISPV